ncbi:MAG: hypothetical protein NZ530_07880 [Thermodesulfobacteriaceae bacterium]|nr:hypothetical protein [Thermodesulfobacteriaceae bacterium]MCX8041905.1 hypothetical protein [Thermodesulfobacteriaceae bacterium]MDW8136732.1 hypothetical protein [Thermodesulfobacterium sp.]
MQFIRTRSGRYLQASYISVLSIEEAKIVAKGKNIEVYKLVAYLPHPLNPAVLGIYESEERACKILDELVEKLTQETEKIIRVPTEY